MKTVRGKAVVITGAGSGIGLALALACTAAYNASKFAVRGCTEALRQELVGTGVCVTCVIPGGVRINIVRSGRHHTSAADSSARREELAAEFDRMARTSPEQAARAILVSSSRGAGGHRRGCPLHRCDPAPLAPCAMTASCVHSWGSVTGLPARDLHWLHGSVAMAPARGWPGRVVGWHPGTAQSSLRGAWKHGSQCPERFWHSAHCSLFLASRGNAAGSLFSGYASHVKSSEVAATLLQDRGSSMTGLTTRRMRHRAAPR